MSFKILYVSATSVEADILKKIEGLIMDSGGYRFGDLEINILISGVGSIATSWSMKQWISENDRPDLVINAGIAGSFKDDIIIGDVVMPFTDCFADAGIEEGSRFLTLQEAGLLGTNDFPFRDGLLFADNNYCDRIKHIIKPVRAITVNTATGTESTREKLVNKFNPDIETMEGASFFYICTRERLPFIAVRAISNRVEPRDKKNWDIPLALKNLSEKIREIFITLM